jgi:hypothetical protein
VLCINDQLTLHARCLRVIYMSHCPSSGASGNVIATTHVLVQVAECQQRCCSEAACLGLMSSSTKLRPRYFLFFYCQQNFNCDLWEQ